MGELVSARSEVKIEYRLHVLENNNYTIWKQHTKNVLEAKGLLEVVTGTVQDARLESHARALLTSALSAENQMKVINCEKAKRIWTRLEAIYENKSSFEKENLLNKLHSYKINNGKDVSKAIGEMETLAARLRLLGEDVSDDALMSAALRALPPQFKFFITVWRSTSRPERTIDNMLTRLMAEIEESNDQDDHALVVNNRFSRMRIGTNSRTPNRNDVMTQRRYFESPQSACTQCAVIQNIIF